MAVQLLKLCRRYYEDRYLKLDEIVDPVYPLWNVFDEHSKDLAELMDQQGWHYGLGLMTVLFSPNRKSEASSVYRLFNETEGQKVVKSDLSILF